MNDALTMYHSQGVWYLSEILYLCQSDVFLGSTAVQRTGTFATEVPSGRQVCNQPNKILNNNEL